ncbi:MAG: hypothetical protein LBI49_02995 [Nocardiopsaceae bacterium]|nr:hypothetical protein [Nocardiopsaceae bacterium]
MAGAAGCPRDRRGTAAARPAPGPGPGRDAARCSGSRSWRTASLVAPGKSVRRIVNNPTARARPGLSHPGNFARDCSLGQARCLVPGALSAGLRTPIAGCQQGAVAAQFPDTASGRDLAVRTSVRQDPRVIAAYLGGGRDRRDGRPGRPGGGPGGGRASRGPGRRLGVMSRDVVRGWVDLISACC